LNRPRRTFPLSRGHDDETAEADVPVSVKNSQLIYAALKACGVSLISALPETWLVHLIQMAEVGPEMMLVRLAKEEEGVGISAGAHLAGAKSAMLMQNHGFLGSVNGIVSLARLYRIPLLMLITYRGEFGERDPWQTEGGGATESVLRALSIPHERLDEPTHVAHRIKKAQTLAESSLKPVALLLCRDLMWEE
jgi:sulfopyruvate decarboxylase subunit alpha